MFVKENPDRKKKKKIAGERYSVKENCNNRLLCRRMGGKLIRKTAYVSFFKKLSKKSEISNLQLQRSRNYEFKICKGYFNVIRNYISPFAVLFFWSVLVVSTDYLKLLWVSLLLRHSALPTSAFPFIFCFHYVDW